MKKTIFITGGAGYVGAMLVTLFAKRDDVERVITIDKEKDSDLLEILKEEDKDSFSKVIFIHDNLYNDTWQDIVKKYNPDTIIHTAWQIRTMYGKEKTQWNWNVVGSNKVFELSFNNISTKKLIYFSTVSSYGAFKENKLDYLFKEEEPFRKTDYLYAEEKRIVEENLLEKFNIHKANGGDVQVIVLRPAAITGPRGRFGRVRFGLQSALSGQLKGRGSFVYNLISFMVSFMPVTKGWLRQFIHEDDVVDIVKMFTFDYEKLKKNYDVFNICPPGDSVLSKDMAKAVNKKTIRIHPRMIQFAFSLMWNLFRGRIPTSTGGWKFYSYPVPVDGSKLTREYQFNYRMGSKDAFVKNEGVYKIGE